VLVVVDDSRSMRANGAALAACRTVALLTQAMTLLDAGDVGVMSFGDSPRLLHALGRPWGSAEGAGVMSRLTFAQERTATSAMLEAVVRTLDRAAEAVAHPVSGSVGPEVRQLVFVVSDGVLAQEARATVKRWVLEAAERNQMLVLVIMDTPDPRNSVVATESVSFVGGKVVRKAYLDDFPFPFYLVVRDTAHLPDAIADVTRQFLEMVVDRG